MKDERLITFVYVFQSRDILVFHPVSLIFYLNRPFIFQRSGPLSVEGLTSIKQKSSPCTYAFTQNGCKGTTFFRNSQTKSPFCKLSFSKMQKCTVYSQFGKEGNYLTISISETLSNSPLKGEKSSLP